MSYDDKLNTYYKKEGSLYVYHVRMCIKRTRALLLECNTKNYEFDIKKTPKEGLISFMIMK